MANFGPQIAADVLAACVAGAAEAAQALSRALDGTFSLTPGAPTTYNAALANEIAGPGLLLALDVGQGGALVFLTEASGLLPEWYAEPDATGKSKLTTLAQELGMLLLPDAFLAVDFQAHRVGRISEALERGGVASGAGVIPLALTGASASGTLYVVWPAPSWQQVFAEPAAPPPSLSPAEKKPTPEPAFSATVSPATKPRFKDFDQAMQALPPYGRSLLRIRVPVIVTLARTKQPVGRIVELGPGSIIQFEKPCTEPLELEVGQQTVATGEAVKVGEKFGLRITAIVLPEERFIAIRGRKAS